MKIMVTGGSGLLGNALIEGLLELGHSVKSFSLNSSPHIQSPGLEVVHGSLTRLSDLYKAFQECNVVFHLAAKTDFWGNYDDFFSVNVEGTKNVIKACQEMKIPHLLYTSTWSTVFPNAHQQGVNESVKYPQKFLAHYPRTKAMAEQLVLNANSRVLTTVVLRSADLWGPGENSVSSRIIGQAKEGRLRTIGDGSNLVDFTYITNCVSAHLLVLGRLTVTSGIGGRVYFITDGQPQKMIDFLNRHMKIMELPPVTGKISTLMANIEAEKQEYVHKIQKRPDQPELTKFKVVEQSCAHWYIINAARNDFGYTPAVSIDTGLEKFKHWYAEKDRKKEHIILDEAGMKEAEPVSIHAGPEIKARPDQPEKKPDTLGQKIMKKRDSLLQQFTEKPLAAKKNIEDKIDQFIVEHDGDKTNVEEVKESLKQEIRYRESLFKITRGLGQTLEAGIIITQMLDSMRSVVNFSSGGVFLIEDGIDKISCATTFGTHENVMRYQIDEPISFPALAIKKNELMIINDIGQDSRFANIKNATDIKSALYCPLALEDEILGCVCLWNNKPEAFSEKEVYSISFIALESARALKNTETLRKLNDKLHFSSLLCAIAKKLSETANLPSQSRKNAIEQVLETIKVLFSFDGIILYRYAADNKILVPGILTGIFSDLDIEDGENINDNVEILAEVSPGELVPVDFRELILGQTKIKTGNLLEKPFQAHKISDNPRQKVFMELAKAGNIKSLYWYPLVGREGALGSLAFFSQRVREWSEDDLQWTDAFCSMFSLYLENMDLADEVQARKSLQDIVMDAMQEGVFTTDLEKKVLIWNKGAEKITGWTEKEVVGNECSLFFKCQTEEGGVKCKNGCPVSKALKERKKLETGKEDILVVSKDGPRIPADLTISPIWGKKGKIIGSMVIFRDVSGWMELSKALEI